MSISRIFRINSVRAKLSGGNLLGTPKIVKSFSLRRFFAYVALILIASLTSVSANARLQCTTAGTNKVVAAGSISVPANAAMGTTIAVLPPDNFPQSCAFDTIYPQSTSATIKLYIPIALGSLAPRFNDVYQTNVTGVGIRYTVNSVKCNIRNWVVIQNILPADCSSTINGAIGGVSTPIDLSVTVSFVVTDVIAAGASFLSTTPGLYIYDEYSDRGFSANDFQGNAYQKSGTGKFVGATCSVNSSSLSVSLPTVKSSAFSAGIGSVAASQPFSLLLSCSGGAKVAITLTDAVNPLNQTNALQLSADSTAKGVGIQVLNGTGSPVLYGPDSSATGNTNQWMIGDSPNGQLQVPLTARYVQTGTVSAGTVKALATFTMSYQ